MSPLVIVLVADNESDGDDGLFTLGQYHLSLYMVAIVRQLNSDARIELEKLGGRGDIATLVQLLSVREERG